MSIQIATQKVIDALDAAGVPYMLTGSLASMFYSFPRSTADADFVVKLNRGELDRIVLELGEGFQVDVQQSFELIGATRRTLIDVKDTAYSIVFFHLSEEPFDCERFNRRMVVDLMNRSVYVPTVEDVIIQKLIWQRPISKMQPPSWQ